ncbi:MAG: VCBS repeat-containing protein [Planctomycetes bacterium]|nr:VCBS repeat-containing protein [Planctomycetota bacterium]
MHSSTISAVCVSLFFMVGLSSAGEVKHTVIELELPAPRGNEDTAGGLLVAEVDDDGRPDILATVRGHLGVYAGSGEKLWIHQADLVVGGQSESQGLPGHHGPGVAAGDIDGDGRTEVVFLTRDGVLHVADGATGREKATARPPVPSGAERWELAIIADFRGKGDRDLLLQATNKDGYRTGRYLAAYAADELLAGGKPLWTTDHFASCAHNGARLADLDGDGRDEVLGETLYSPEGQLLVRAAEYRGHMDSVFAADVRPDIEGLEVVLLEEGSNYVQLLSRDGVIWREHFRRQEPQNAAVGRFKKGADEIFIWCRSRYNEHQKPFVFDSRGEVVFDYALDDFSPDGWTASGVEVIHTIDWTGSP